MPAAAPANRPKPRLALGPMKAARLKAITSAASADRPKVRAIGALARLFLGQAGLAHPGAREQQRRIPQAADRESHQRGARARPER
jgi:hypothetical protein